MNEIRGGASFVSLARQFSESASALSGGDLGWVTQGQLAPELEDVLKKMTPPTLTDPIRTPGGYYILALRDRKIPAKEDTGGTQVSLRRLEVPLSEDATKQEFDTQMQAIKALRAKAKTCDDMQTLADKSGSSLSGDLGWIHITELPDDLRNVVKSLPMNKVSDPIRRTDGIMVLMVCDKKEEKSTIPTREEVGEALLRQRLELQADRYLRDLRSSATVDTWI